MPSVRAVVFLLMPWVRVFARAGDGLFWGVDQAEIQCDPGRFTGLLKQELVPVKPGRMRRA